MADKNLHDIKIDELDNKKKTPLKNILTLLALLFIILVISVVITKLILNTGDSEGLDNNYTTTSTQTEEESNSNVATGAAALAAGAVGTIAATANSATDSAKNVANTAKDTTKDAVNSVTDSAKNAVNSATDSAKNAVKSTEDTAKSPNINNALKDKENGSSKTKVTLRDHQPVKTVKELKHTTTTKTPTKVHTAPKSTSTKSASYSNSDKVIVKRNTSTHTSTHSVGSTVSHLSNGFYIKVGTFKNTTNIIKAIRKTGLNYKLVKTDNGLTRAYIGRFSTKSSARANLNKAKTVSPSAFIYEEK